MEPSHRRRPIEVTLPSYGVFVLESHHAPGFRMASQCHDFLEIFYVLGGSGAFHIDERTHPCRQGDLVAVPAGRTHRIEDDPAAPLALYGICIAPQVWRHEPALLDHLPPGRLPINKLLATQVRGDLRRLLFEQRLARPGSQLLILGMSRRRFTHLFRQVARSSWSSYLTRLRIDYACQLLRETSRSIIATAFECGYEDLSSFYRAFKRQRGLPPRVWREQGSRV